MYKHIILVLVLTIPISYINFSGYIMGATPTNLQVISSVIFNLFWLTYGLYMGYKNNTSFLTFSAFYWGIGASFLIIGYVIPPLALVGAMSILTFSGASYGLRYLIGLPSDFTLMILCIIIPFLISKVGYYGGISSKKCFSKTVMQ